MATTVKGRELTLRKRADRQGLRLVKSRRRDRMALDYGCYWLLPASDQRDNTTRAGLSPADGLTLEQVEQRLARPRGRG